MALYDVKERIRKKKRRKRKRLMIILSTLLILGMAVALFNATRFQIQKVVFKGQDEIPLAYLENEAESLIGKNLYLLSKEDVLTFLRPKAYFDSMTLKRRFPNTLEITVVEKKAEVNYAYNGVMNLLTKEGILLEAGVNQLDSGLFLIDDQDLPDLGRNLYEDELDKQNFLKEFRSLQMRNQSELPFNQVDLRNMAKIKTYYQDLEIWLGYPESLKEKLNGAINIIQEGQLEQVKGYVDVSYLEYPVFYDEAKAPILEVVDTPMDGLEIPDEIMGILEEPEEAPVEIDGNP